MPTNVRSRRWPQIVAWAVTVLFLLGFFFPHIGAWTGPILGAWFVGTQKPRRGFLWMVAFGFIPSLIFGWRNFPLTGPRQVVEYLGWTLVAAVLGVLPFTFHRLTSPRLPRFLSTLPLPPGRSGHPLARPGYAHWPGFNNRDTHVPHFLVRGSASLVLES